MFRAALLLVIAVAQRAAATGSRAPHSREYLLSKITSSRPADVPADFDCAWRAAALNYALALQPWLTAADVQGIVDALAQAALGCNTTATLAAAAAHVPTPRLALPASSDATSIYVDYAHGSDSNAGTEAAPLKTLSAAVAAARTARAAGSTPAIVLRGGTHVLAATIALTPGDSGLTFSAYPGEAPVVSGAAVVDGLVWTPVNRTEPAWGPVLNDTNAVFGECPAQSVPDKGVMANWQACQASCQGNATCNAWTYHTPACTGCAGFIGHCCWRTDDTFPSHAQVGVVSQGRNAALNVWSAPLVLPPGVHITAMQVNGHRATLARYPNADPERDIFPKGYINGGDWIAPVPAPVWNETYTVDLGAQSDPAAGYYIKYTVGIGGNADRYDPPRSFWASRDFGPQSRWNEMHLRSPAGLDVGSNLPHAPYADISQLTVRTWRLGHW